MTSLDKKKILFISHEASLSGAPILLYNLVKWLSQHTNIAIEVLFLRDGNLRPDFVPIAQNTYSVAGLDSFFSKNWRRVKYRINAKYSESLEQTAERIAAKLADHQYDLIFGNTLESLLWLLPFKKRGLPCICAVHELTFSVESTFSKQYVLDNIGKVDQIIAGSRAVGENLIDRYGAPKEKVAVIHSFVEDNLNIHQDADILKAALEIPKDAFVFGLASSQELRKGTDLAPRLVYYLHKIAPELSFKFINLGGGDTNMFVRNAKLDAEKLGISDKMIFVGHTKYPNDYLNIFDVFVMLSREDPFPLVTLTAAQLAKPIIAFQQSGGADEFLENGVGILCPYLDVEEMASQIAGLARDKNYRDTLGQKAKAELENKYQQDSSMQKIIKLMSNTIKK